METQNKKAAIIGAGITGLTTAYYLNKAGIDVTVFEKTGHIGGVINSIAENGFLYETGPNTGTLSNIETVQLFRELANDFELEIANDSAKKRLIWKKGKWHPLPSNPISAITTPLFTLYDKFRILGEPFRKPGTDPFETVAALVRRRLGKSFLDYAVEPFISGIYAGDPEYLVTKYALPKLYALEQEYGSFIGGSFKKAKLLKAEKQQGVTKQIFSAKGGLINIINALAKNIGRDKIITNADITIEKTPSGYKVDNQDFTHVITTTNAAELPKLLTFVDNADLYHIINLKYARVAEIAIGFKKWDGMNLDAFGGLVPGKERKNILGALFMSTLFSGRAPEGGALITTFVGGTKNESLLEHTEDEILKIVEKDIVELLGLKKFNPDLLKIFIHNRAIAQYGRDSEQRLQAINKIQKTHENLILAGSIRDGIGMADRIKQATTIAQQIIQQS